MEKTMKKSIRLSNAMLKTDKFEIIIEESRIKVKEKGLNLLNEVRFGEMYSSISCGVRQVYGIPLNMANSMIKLKEASMHIAKKNGVAWEEIIAYVFHRLFNTYRHSKFLVLSDNSSNGKSIMHNVLDVICDTVSNEGINPNSGNHIKVWVYRVGSDPAVRRKLKEKYRK